MDFALSPYLADVVPFINSDKDLPGELIAWLDRSHNLKFVNKLRQRVRSGKLRGITPPFVPTGAPV
jgi:hypothetical protein